MGRGGDYKGETLLGKGELGVQIHMSYLHVFFVLQEGSCLVHGSAWRACFGVHVEGARGGEESGRQGRIVYSMPCYSMPCGPDRVCRHFLPFRPFSVGIRWYRRNEGIHLVHPIFDMVGDRKSVV